MVLSFELKFKIWGRSDQWLLRYSTFDILRSSSIEGHLHFKHFLFWFGPLSLTLNLKKDPISGCWDIQHKIFWGHLPLEVAFNWRSSSVGDRLPSEVILISSIFDFGLVPWAKVWNFRKIHSVVTEIFNFLYFEVVFHWRSSSFWAFLILV